MIQPNLQDWVWVEMMLVQAMLGNISDNFLQIVLRFDMGDWKVTFTLRDDDDADREAIEDILDSFEDFIGGVLDKVSDSKLCTNAGIYNKIEFSDSAPRVEQSHNCRIVFRKRL